MTAAEVEAEAYKIMGQLDAIDCRELRVCRERGYSMPTFNAKTGSMNARQWKSWQKLHKLGLVVIEGAGVGAEADDIVATSQGLRVAKLL